MADGEEVVGVVVKFTDGEVIEILMTSDERERLHKAFVGHVNTKDSMIKGGSFNVMYGQVPGKVALDFRLIKYIM